MEKALFVLVIITPTGPATGPHETPTTSHFVSQYCTALKASGETVLSLLSVRVQLVLAGLPMHPSLLCTYHWNMQCSLESSVPASDTGPTRTVCLAKVP